MLSVPVTASTGQRWLRSLFRGHCETAAGVAGLLKVLAMLKQTSIPPLASHKSLNPKIPPLEPERMCIATQTMRWDAPLLTACINSYGAAGSNAALLCSEAPRHLVSQPNSQVTDSASTSKLDLTYPIIISAASNESLIANMRAFGEYLQQATMKPPRIGDLSFTLSERRKHLRHRFITTASDTAALAESLLKTDNLDESSSQSFFEASQESLRPVVLAFGGQTKRNVGLEPSVYEGHPEFRSHIDNCDNILKSLGFAGILTSIFEQTDLHDIVMLQSGTFAAQYASAMCWIEAGLKVDAVVGHSFGELTAMAVSGTLSLGDALKLVASRASLMQSKWGDEPGTMLVMHSSDEVVHDVIKDASGSDRIHDLEIACYNSPSSQVVVGSRVSIARVETLLKESFRFKDVRCQRLDVTHGFHSKFTEPLLQDLDHVSSSLTFHKSADIHLESCTPDSTEEILVGRPSQHAREPVHFWRAVRRIEQRFGSCQWLEAGFNSPIIPMIKKAVSNQDGHIFQPGNVKNFADGTKFLADITVNLWQQGIPVSYWNFASTRNRNYKQIWLPPYQFQPTRHWLPNVDRTIEAQQNQQNLPAAQTTSVEGDKALEPSRLVTCRGLPNSDQASTEFSVHVATDRFKKIVSGHAVRQRPLCPASMYMECALMAVQTLCDPIEAGTLYFADLSFQAALGVDLARDVSLTLEKGNAKNFWSFSLNSTSKATTKSRTTVHGKGTIGLTTEPTKLGTYQRLISDSISLLTVKPNTEKLQRNRAYGLFSQVVHYADFLQGISSITLDGHQAVADIELPKADIGSTESSATQYCDCIAIDTFIQVVGLLINSSDMVSSEDVFVATGVDSTSVSAVCDLDVCKSWTVYVKFTPLTDDQATGDIFVLTRDGTLAMTIFGVGFTKLLLSKLERFLDSANAKPANKQSGSRGPDVPVATLRVPPPPSSDATPDQESDSTPELTRSTSMTSVDDSPSTPEAADGAGAESLRKIIAEYSGLSGEEIADDATMGDLGVDSLAATELAEELQNRFNKEVDSDNLLMSTFDALSKELVPPIPAKAKTTKTKSALSSTGSSEDQTASGSSPSKATNESTSQNPQRRNDLLRLLSESSGAPASSIKDNATLAEIGVDSLSAVEMKNEIEDTFAVEIEDDRFTLESTVKEVADFLGVGQSQQSQQSKQLPAAASKPTVNGSNQNVKSASQTSVEPAASRSFALTNPMEPLAQFDSHFAQSADKRGFLNYCEEIGPRQDELLLAYLLEAFKSLGADLWTLRCGQTLPEVHHLPKHAKVMRRLFDILEKHEVIVSQGPGFARGRKEASRKSSQELFKSFIADFPQYGGEARLMNLTGPKLAECLSGKADPVALMFRTPASQKIMEEYYCESPMLSTLTEQMVVFLREVLLKSQNASASEPIRVVEVGAGFGGTTARLAEVLQASGVAVEYTFTDIAPTLVKNAKSKFAKYNWMIFQTFNLENNVPESLENRFDVVISTNCVHATSNKTASIRKLMQILNPSGFIVLSEVTELVDWYDICFGLLDGWWLDVDKRYPLQAPERWMSCFKEAGLPSASFSQGSTPESNIQRLLVASKKQVSTPPTAPSTSASDARGAAAVQTVIYKEVDGVKIAADIYLPKNKPAARKAMPAGIVARV